MMNKFTEAIYHYTVCAADGITNDIFEIELSFFKQRGPLNQS